MQMTESSSPGRPPGLPLDWSLEFDIHCPACRYNLRGLREPRCTECGLRFRWQALFGISCPRCGEPLGGCDEPSCPRCDLALNWDRLLSEADASQFQQFEYSSTPIRAGRTAWWRTMRPRSFWGEIPLERPPVTPRLHRFGRVALAVFLVGLLCHLAMVTGAFIKFFPPDPFHLLQEATAIAAVVLGPPLITALLLPRFTPTLSRFRLRADQLDRVFAYGRANAISVGLFLIAAPILWIAIVFVPPIVLYCFGAPFALITLPGPLFTLAGFVGLLTGFRNLTVLDYSNLAGGVFLLVATWAWWWRYLAVSLRGYLRLDFWNTWALFLSTQAIVVLCVVLVLVNLPGLGFDRLLAQLLTPSLWGK